MSKGTKLANSLWGLPQILKIVLAIFLDIIYGICRFVDGLTAGDWIKAIVGFLWIFYGLVIGWIVDIICTILNIRPPLF